MCFISCVYGCKKNDVAIADPFKAGPSAATINPGVMDEASGIADSKANPGYLWVQEDGGNPNQLFLLSYTGALRKRLRLKGIENRDWEDITLAKGPESGKNYIYVADIGNNNLSSTRFFIYRFPEPPVTTDVVDDFDKISFNYPDEDAHDAEALLVDNRSKDIYIITKRDTLSRIYRIPYPQSITNMNEAEMLGQLPFNGVVSAAFSPGGDEVLIKTYSTVYYWKIGNGGSIRQVLYTEPVKLAYQAEPQGEAISFKNDNSGFFTLSERPHFIQDVKLYFYLRN
jgi:hypothetical protein